MMIEVVDISEKFIENIYLDTLFIFISATITIDFCTPHLYMETMPVVSEPDKGGKPCHGEI